MASKSLFGSVRDFFVSSLSAIGLIKPKPKDDSTSVNTAPPISPEASAIAESATYQTTLTDSSEIKSVVEESEQAAESGSESISAADSNESDQTDESESEPTSVSSSEDLEFDSDSAPLKASVEPSRVRHPHMKTPVWNPKKLHFASNDSSPPTSMPTESEQTVVTAIGDDSSTPQSADSEVLIPPIVPIAPPRAPIKKSKSSSVRKSVSASTKAQTKLSSRKIPAAQSTGAEGKAARDRSAFLAALEVRKSRVEAKAKRSKK